MSVITLILSVSYMNHSILKIKIFLWLRCTEFLFGIYQEPFEIFQVFYAWLSTCIKHSNGLTNHQKYRNYKKYISHYFKKISYLILAVYWKIVLSNTKTE